MSYVPSVDHRPEIAIWAICAASIGGVLGRPRGIPEWFWAVAGAGLIAALGLLPLAQIGRAIAKGTDVYLFLAGMMVLAEVARREGVFDWAASHAVRVAKGSATRLFALVYAVGTAVTIALSNDATAVVLTPAVAAAVRRAKVEPLPYLLACAFVANAASFVLPISNPANLVVFAGQMPPLLRWLSTFLVPSLLSLGTTFAVLALLSRKALQTTVASAIEPVELDGRGRATLAGIALSAVALLAASALGLPLGATTFACGAALLLAVCARDGGAFGDVFRSVTWTILLLVAALFVLVAALDSTGLLDLARAAFAAVADWPPLLGVLAAAGATAAVANLINNLPAALLAGTSSSALGGHAALHAAIAIGIDLGPNLSVTGSLATVLWLIALRREKVEVTAWTFLRAGALVMPAALALAAAAVLLTTR